MLDLAVVTLILSGVNHVTGTVSDQPIQATSSGVDANGSSQVALRASAGNNSKEEDDCKLTVVHFDWLSVSDPYIIAVFLMFSALIKIGFHHSGYLVTKIPESCVLIVLGILAGFLFRFIAQDVPEALKELQPTLFFLVLLPPIVLEASYSLHNRTFFDNIGSVLVYAIIGTGLNCFLIGPTLYVFYRWGLMGTLANELTMSQCLVYAALIVAVDPVAVLAIFQEVGVNDVLYFLVFGESLLNDAVTVVLYKTMDSINCMGDQGEPLTPLTYFVAFMKFANVWIVGSLIGIFFGALTALVTRLTEEVRVVEPLALFMMAYLSYLTSELFHISGIISLTVCGLMQAQYAFHNISQKSYTTVKYFTKMAGAASDCVIFLYLGVNVVRSNHVFEALFVTWCIFLCLVYRFVVTYSLTLILNRFFRLRQISGREQFIMAYGGLRGAVCFSLVSLLKAHLSSGVYNMFMTTTLALIIQTVFLQGATVKLLVRLLDLGIKDSQPRLLIEELSSNVIDHIMTGIEEVVGDHGRNVFQDWLWKIDYRYIKHWLQRNPMTKDERIMKLYEKIVIKHHYQMLSGSKAADRFSERMPVELEEANANDVLPSIGLVQPPTPHGSLTGSAEVAAVSSSPRRLSLVTTGSQRALRASLLTALPKQTGRTDQPFGVGIEERMLLSPAALLELENAEQKGSKSQVPSVRAFDAGSVRDLRKLLSASRMILNVDRNSRLEMSDDKGNDLVQQLQEKNKRMERLRRGLLGAAAALGSGSLLPLATSSGFVPGTGTSETPVAATTAKSTGSLRNIVRAAYLKQSPQIVSTEVQQNRAAAAAVKGASDASDADDIDLRARCYSEATVLKSRGKMPERAAAGGALLLETVKEGEDDGASHVAKATNAADAAGQSEPVQGGNKSATQIHVLTAKLSSHQIDKTVTASAAPVVPSTPATQDRKGGNKLARSKARKLSEKWESAKPSTSDDRKRGKQPADRTAIGAASQEAGQGQAIVVSDAVEVENVGVGVVPDENGFQQAVSVLDLNLLGRKQSEHPGNSERTRSLAEDRLSQGSRESSGRRATS